MNLHTLYFIPYTFILYLLINIKGKLEIIKSIISIFPSFFAYRRYLRVFSPRHSDSEPVEEEESHTRRYAIRNHYVEFYTIDDKKTSPDQLE